MPQTLTYATARPVVSSPLASNAPSRPAAKRNISYAPAFPTARPLRPFASIANATIPTLPLRSGKTASGKKPVKIIEPPKNFRSEFILNLTQAELRRED